MELLPTSSAQHPFSTDMSLPAGFQWPWQYEFPPFFTVQPNTDTRRKQLDAWCDLVLAYHRVTKSYLLDVNEALSSPLFFNSKINSILEVHCQRVVARVDHFPNSISVLQLWSLPF